jgi:hypothetical protein
MKKFFVAMGLAAAVTCAVVAMRRRGCCGGTSEDTEGAEGNCSCGCS